MSQIEIMFKPLGQWPRAETKQRGDSRFRVNLSNTKKILAKELRFLKVSRVIIQADIAKEDLNTRDNMPLEASKAKFPGVILTFASVHGNMSIACDRYDSWQCNLRAIALTLCRLRMADLYGCTHKGEQYVGWAQLPAPKSSYFEKPEDAFWWIANECSCAFGSLMTSRELFIECYRDLVKKFHPDTGGSKEEFCKLQAAKDICEKHFAKGQMVNA